MSLVDRLLRLFQAKLHDLLARLRPSGRSAVAAPPDAPLAPPPANDPLTECERALLALNARLIEGKKQVAIALADEKHFAKLAERESATAAEWERRAVAAIEQGDERLANEALRRKKEHLALAASYERERRSYETASAPLETALAALSDEIEAVKRKRVTLRARARNLTLKAASPLEAYFTLAGRRYRAVGQRAFVLEPRAPGGRPVEVRLHDDGLVVFSAALGLLPSGEASAKLALRLLETNATALTHCAYGLRDGVLIVAATRPLADLGPAEVEALLSDFDLAIARHEREMTPAPSARSN